MRGRNRKRGKTISRFSLFVSAGLFWLGFELLVSILIQRTNSTSPSPPNPEETKWPPPKIIDAWMDDHRRIVLAATNAEYVDFCDNFAQSLLSLNVTNFILIALDKLAFERLQTKYGQRTIAYYDSAHHTTGEARFRSEAFRDLTSTRPRFMKPFLEANYTIFYNDVDVVWRQNAWEALPMSDTTGKGKPSTIVFGDGPGQLCTCLMYMTPDAIGLLDEWIDEIQKGTHETDQFAFIDVCKRRKVRFRGGQTDQMMVLRFNPKFPTGKEYDWTGSANNDEAAIVHNNWITGKQEKLERFQKAGLWRISR